MLTMFKRPSFVSLTVATIALYILDNPDKISRQTFRGLVLTLALSWIYDFAWIFFFGPTLEEEDAEGAGMDYTLTRFVRLISFISFFFKIVVVLVFWKNSLDFTQSLRGQQGGSIIGGAGNQTSSSARNEPLDLILAEYDVWINATS